MATTPAFQIVQENLLRTFLKIFQDTVPQFIGENNTQVDYYGVNHYQAREWIFSYILDGMELWSKF